MRKPFTSVFAILAIIAATLAPAVAFEIRGSAGSRINAEEIARFDQPWAMTFLPDATMLVTTKPGYLHWVTQQGKMTQVSGMWRVVYGGQGGLGDVVAHPDFVNNRLVYISYADGSSGGDAGAAVVRARFDTSGGKPRLVDPQQVWVQEPKTSGRGHYAHRLAFGPDGKLYITAGDRQELAPAQDLNQALGKIIRLNPDGTVPSDNPWQDKGSRAQAFWSMGHRNPLGIAFDAQGRLWAHEMGPRHGDELNLIVKGKNYGWPVVSEGSHYSGQRIPGHATRPEFEKPKFYWVPAISPAGLVFYNGRMFERWRGDAFIGGLSSRAMIRVGFRGAEPFEAERFRWGQRVREIEQGPAGALWVLEDGNNGRLLKLTPG